MGGENAQGDGFPCWLIYVEFFGAGDSAAFKEAEKKVKAIFGVGTHKVPKRMYLLLMADGGRKMMSRELATRFTSKEAAEGRLVYLCGESPNMIGKLGVEKWDGK